LQLKVIPEHKRTWRSAALRGQGETCELSMLVPDPAPYYRAARENKLEPMN